MDRKDEPARYRRCIHTVSPFVANPIYVSVSLLYPLTYESLGSSFNPFALKIYFRSEKLKYLCDLFIIHVFHNKKASRTSPPELFHFFNIRGREKI